MAPVTQDRYLRQMLTASIAQRQTAIQDLVYNSTPMTRILRDRLRIRTATGPEIRIPLLIDTLGAQWFAGYDKLRIDPKEIMNSATFNWKRVVSMFSLTGDELMFNSGEAQVIDLMEAYLNAAEMAVKQDWEVALFGDGTQQGGRTMVGLGGAIPVVANAGTYGGIDRAANPIWRTSSFSVPGGDFPDIGTVWDSTTARPIISRIALNRSYNGRYADLIIADPLSYQAIEASFVAHQRITTERAGRLGFQSLAYHTAAGLVDIVAAGGIGNVMPANTIFGIDTEGAAIYEFASKRFTPFHPGDGMKPINQDAIAQGIEWAGEFVLENPRTSYRLRTA